MSTPADTVADPSIPTLAAVLDPVELSKQLSRALPPGDWGTVGETRLHILKWHRGSRCTFELALRTTRGWQELIGKVYAKDRPDIYDAMEKIRQAGFASEQEFAIAQPVAYLDSLRLLLYEKIPGTRARKLIVNATEPERVGAIERCARWLARFQLRAPRSGRIFRMEDCLTDWKRWWLHLAHLNSPIANKTRRLLEHLESGVPGAKGVGLCAGHGMYTCGQVLFDNRRTVTIDWDTFNLADPGHDVARFLIDLKRMALKYFGSICALDWAVDKFLATYMEEVGSEATANLAFQEACVCLERAKSDADKHLSGWQERAEAMLDEGLRALSDQSH